MSEKNGKTRGRFEGFQSISQADVPKGRDGKHKEIVLELLESLADCAQAKH